MQKLSTFDSVGPPGYELQLSQAVQQELLRKEQHSSAEDKEQRNIQVHYQFWSRDGKLLQQEGAGVVATSITMYDTMGGAPFATVVATAGVI